MGWAYYSRVGIPSGRSAKKSIGNNHRFFPVEQDANRRAFIYFNKNVENFKDDDSRGGLGADYINRGWNFTRNPLNINGSGYVQFFDWGVDDETLLNNLKIKAKWYDYASWLLFPIGPVAVGYYNYNRYND